MPFKLVFLLPVLFAINNTTNAQRIYVVADSETRVAIPYTIIVFGGKSGQNHMTTDEHGAFQITNRKSADLIVQNIGYEPLHIKSTELKDTTFLVRKDNKLEEVIVQADKPEKTISNIRRRNNVRYVGNTAGIQKVTRLYFNKEDSGAYKKINAVGLRMKIDPDANPCRLLLYEQGADGKPGRELINRSVIITQEHIKHRIAKIDLSQDGIFTNSNAVFIGVEYIGDIFRKEGVIVGDTSRDKYHSVIYMTLSESRADTYIRVLYDDVWHLMDDTVSNGYPHNLMVSVTYE